MKRQSLLYYIRGTQSKFTRDHPIRTAGASMKALRQVTLKPRPAYERIPGWLGITIKSVLAKLLSSQTSAGTIR